MYRRKGLLDDIPHVRLIQGVITVRTEDAGRVKKSLEELRAESRSRTVALTEGDREALEP